MLQEHLHREYNLQESQILISLIIQYKQMEPLQIMELLFHLCNFLEDKMKYQNLIDQIFLYIFLLKAVLSFDRIFKMNIQVLKELVLLPSLMVLVKIMIFQELIHQKISLKNLI